MLILSRKVGEEILIGDGITVAVNRISGDRVTLAFKAPAHVRILRGELMKLLEKAAEQERQDPPAGASSKTQPIAAGNPATNPAIPASVRARFTQTFDVRATH